MGLLEIMGKEEISLLFGKEYNNRDNEAVSMKECTSFAGEREDQKLKGADLKPFTELRQADSTNLENQSGTLKRKHSATKIEQSKIYGELLGQVNQTRQNEVQIRTNTSGCEEKWVSVFIGNIPPFANNRWVFEKFKIMGKVVDYYVSSRVSKFTKKPFEFVRFQSLEDANRAVDHFNGMWVDGFSLEVELARYPRRLLSDEADRKIQITMGMKRPGIRGSKEGLGMSNTISSWINPNKSFAQVLQGRSETVAAHKGLDDVLASPSRIRVKAVVEECGWLNAAVVAKIKWGVSVVNVMNGLMGHIKGLVSINRLGIRKVILRFNSIEDRNVALSLGEWMELVEDASEWKGELVCMDKLWKLSCTGIPLTAWNSISFRSIAQVWGSLVHIEYNTRKGNDFSVANFVIETKMEFSNTDIDLLVGNVIFPIKVSGTIMDVNLARGDDQHAGQGSKEWWTEQQKNSFVSCDKNSNLATIKVSDAKSIDEAGQNIMYMEDTVELTGNKLPDSPHIAETRLEMDDVQAISIHGAEVSLNLGKDVDLCMANIFDQSPEFQNVGATAIPIKALSGPVRDMYAADPVKVGSSVVFQENLFSNRSVIENSTDEYDVVNKILSIEPGLDLDNAQNDFEQGISSEVCIKNESQIEDKSVTFSGFQGKVDREVKTMMELGNLLDIPNAYQFEEAVRDTTLEELEDESSFIGVRVKSKRKNGGKTKVQFGCRVKKG